MKIGIRGWGAVSEKNFLSWEGAENESLMLSLPLAPAVRTNE